MLTTNEKFELINELMRMADELRREAHQNGNDPKYWIDIHHIYDEINELMGV